MKKINTFLRCCCLLALFAAFSSSLNAQCSIDLVGQTAAPVCNDNGTPFDLTDDFITIELQVNGTNTGANGYSVCVVGGAPLTGTGSYGMASTFNLPAGSAGGGNVNIEVKDVDDNTCDLSPASTIVDTGACSPWTIDITDPCNCANGVDCDGDFTNEFVSETVTITASAGLTWSYDAAGSDAANIFADACAGTTIVDGTTMVETAPGVYEFTFLKPVGVAVNTAFLSDTGIPSGILTSACPACPSNCPTVDLDAPNVCDGDDIVMVELDCTDFVGFPGFAYDLYVYFDGVSFDAPAGYVPTVTPTSFPADDANLALVDFDFVCGTAPTVAVNGVTIGNTQDLTFFALPFDYNTFEYIDAQCGFETVTSTVYPNLSIANVVESCDNVSADLLGTDGSVVTSIVEACTGTDPVVIDFTAFVTANFDPTTAPAGCTPVLTQDAMCAPLEAPAVPDKVVHCVGKAFAGIDATCGACAAPGQTGQTTMTGGAFAFAGGGVVTDGTATITGIPDGAIIENITISNVGINQTSVGNIVLGAISPGGIIVPLMAIPGAQANLADLSAASPITFDDAAATSSFAAGDGLGDADVVCAADGICDFFPEDPLGLFAFNAAFFQAVYPGTVFGASLADAGAGAVNGDWTLFATDFAVGGDVASWDITIDWFLPAQQTNWYDEAGNVVFTGETFTPDEATLNTPGTYNFTVECVCGGCTSPLAPVALTVVDCSCDDGCTYLLVLEDTEGNGWDAASIDVRIDEASTTNYKMTVADGTCKVIPICIGDGGTIDLTYWNGANELEHAITVLDPLGNVAFDNTGTAVEYDGNIPVNQTMRIKSECPFASCSGATEDFTVRITMGTFPEEQSWEIYEGAASTTIQGSQVIGINATAYTGLAPGFQIDYDITLDKCGTYTFVAFDGFNDAWNGGNWELITDNINYGVEIDNPAYSHYGDALVLSLINNGDPSFGGLGFGDEDRLEFTVACEPSCTTVNVTDASADACVTTSQVVLPVATPEVCYPNCNHALGCDIMVRHILLVDGLDITSPLEPLVVFGGTAVPYTGQVEMPLEADPFGLGAGILPVGCHKYITEYTYCDGVITKCTADLNIVTDPNPVMTCNDNVLVSLASPTTPGGVFTLGECVVRVTPDMVMEAPASECVGVFEEYTVTVLDANGNPIVQLVPNC